MGEAIGPLPACRWVRDPRSRPAFLARRRADQRRKRDRVEARLRDLVEPGMGQRVEPRIGARLEDFAQEADARHAVADQLATPCPPELFLVVVDRLAVRDGAAIDGPHPEPVDHFATADVEKGIAAGRPVERGLEQPP